MFYGSETQAMNKLYKTGLKGETWKELCQRLPLSWQIWQKNCQGIKQKLNLKLLYNNYVLILCNIIFNLI